MAYLTQYSGSVPVIKFNIDQSMMTIGQDINMDICVPEDSISDNHCVLEAVKKNDSYRFIIKSHEDEAQLIVNSETVSVAELKDGDWIVLGEVEFQFTDDGIFDIKIIEIPVSAEANSSQPNTVSINSVPIQLNQEVPDETVPMASDNLQDEHQFSRRLNFF